MQCKNVLEQGDVDHNTGQKFEENSAGLRPEYKARPTRVDYEGEKLRQMRSVRRVEHYQSIQAYHQIFLATPASMHKSRIMSKKWAIYGGGLVVATVPRLL